jgi:hypothetical protein
MTTYVYEEIRWPSGVRKLKCRNCGRRFTRSRTFTQTINPFNKNAAGQPKTRQEIYAELKAEANAWQPDDLCTTCATEARHA